MKNKNSKTLLALLVLAPLNFQNLYAEEKVEIYRCLDDKTYVGLIRSINNQIDKLSSSKKNELAVVDSIIKFNNETAPLAAVLGSGNSNDKISAYLNALKKDENNDTDFVIQFKKKYGEDGRSKNFSDLPPHLQLERFKNDLHLIGLGIISKANAAKLNSPEEKTSFVDKMFDEYKKSYGHEDSALDFEALQPEIDSFKKKIGQYLNNPSTHTAANKKISNELGASIDRYIEGSTQLKINCLEDIQLNADAREREREKEKAKKCADKIENQMHVFAEARSVLPQVFNLTQSSPEYKYFDDFEYDRLIEFTRRGTKEIDKTYEKDSDGKSVTYKESLVSFIENYNNLFRANNERPPALDASRIESINDSYSSLIANEGLKAKMRSPNIQSVVNVEKLEDYQKTSGCGSPKQQEIPKLNECLEKILKMNNYSESEKSFPLVNIRRTLDLTSISPESKQSVANLVNSPDFPADKIVHYLNLLNYAKNKYLLDNSNNTQCGQRNNPFIRQCVRGEEHALSQSQASLKVLLQLGDKLNSNVVNNKNFSEIDLAAIKTSCEDLKPEGDIKILCNGVKVENANNQSSAYARYQRGEIPVYQDGTWKWKKKTSTLQHIATGAVHGTQQVLPTWLSLLQTKGAVDYEAERAIYMKQYNYMQNQYMQNWLQNYYANPQTFNNGYYNIYNPYGYSYTTGFGF